MAEILAFPAPSKPSQAYDEGSIPFTRSSDFRGLASGSAEPSDVIPVAIPTSPAAEARLAALSLHLVSPASVDFPEVIENLGGA
ncbi:hypothetical protein Saro_2975 [Novosphingobium aromaticivorans DSM 12444]|uniref:Uncharacterized protein n=1 Tax=Novosphingobium aromaticivorans (strain ATCC 700278 / DSM 12444 / CCUG 56034 / CIP 105152 / NBRC 16084 / F199) TaxID=279238 RepID=Q2G413_NOVAD|nr:hypothetical protein Saro_2975 [Novosphingobium aromaticivorans DSM 12444]